LGVRVGREVAVDINSSCARLLVEAQGYEVEPGGGAASQPVVPAIFTKTCAKPVASSGSRHGIATSC
jgi:hypothetical protein